MVEIALRSRLSQGRLAWFSVAQWEAAGLVVLSAVALASRFWAIAHKSIWLDEAVSWKFSNASIPHMVDLTAHDVHPPLYYGVLHYWTQMAGNSEASLRAPSAIFGAATIVLLAVVAWRISGWLLAIAASVLLMANGAYLAATQQARMYPLLGLLTLASSLALAGFVIKPSVPRFVAYAALAVALVYTHYSGFIVLAAQGGVFALYGVDRAVRDRNGWILGAGLMLVAVVALAYVPWWSTFRAHPRPAGGGYPDISVALLRNTGRSALGLDKAGGAWLAFALPLLALGVYGVAKRWRNPRVLSVGAIALVPIGQILVSILFEPVFSVRQVTPYIPGLAFVCALGFVEAMALVTRINAAGRVVALAAVVVFAACLTALMSKGLTDTYTGSPQEDWRAAADDLRGFHGPIYLSAGYTLLPFSYYYGITPNAQSFDLWSPEKQPVGQTEMIGISHQQVDTVLSALGTSVSVKGRQVYPGITFLEVSVLHHTTMNVEVPLGQEGSAQWSVNPDGYVETMGDESPFTCKCDLDADGDGLADSAFTVFVEYLDASTASFDLYGPSPADVLWTQPRANTMQWRTAAINVSAGAPIGQTFALSRGVVLRQLQVVRTQLENADVFGSYQGASRWVVRPDGYVQSADHYSYIDAAMPLDADNNGEIDRAFRIDFEYQAPGGGALAVFGLTPEQQWRSVALSPSSQGADGQWRTMSVQVPKGAHLQTRVYVDRGVTLRSVTIEPVEGSSGNTSP